MQPESSTKYQLKTCRRKRKESVLGWLEQESGCPECILWRLWGADKGSPRGRQAAQRRAGWWGTANLPTETWENGACWPGTRGACLSKAVKWLSQRPLHHTSEMLNSLKQPVNLLIIRRKLNKWIWANRKLKQTGDSQLLWRAGIGEVQRLLILKCVWMSRKI